MPCCLVFGFKKETPTWKGQNGVLLENRALRGTDGRVYKASVNSKACMRYIDLIDGNYPRDNVLELRNKT